MSVGMGARDAEGCDMDSPMVGFREAIHHVVVGANVGAKECAEAIDGPPCLIHVHEERVAHRAEQGV